MGNAREEATGKQMGDIETILKNYSAEQGGYDKNYDINSYKTQGLDLGMLNQLSQKYYGQAQSNLYGQQQRTAGNAGALGANQGFAMGLSNPYAHSQHSMGNVYQGYANAFGNLQGDFLGQMMKNPQTAFQSQLGANNANFQNLYQLLALKSGLATQRDTGVAREIAGGLIGGGGQVGAAYAGK